MAAVYKFWSKLEEGAIAFLLASMTLVTFVYVVLNNLYTPFYDLSDWLADKDWTASSDFFLKVGDFFIGLAQEMTWSTALTKALFAWLLFLGMAYGVRTAGHIGVDAVVKLCSKPVQKVLAIVAALACLLYASMMFYASFDWVKTLFNANLYAEDLEQIHIKLWYIGAVVPVGFALVWLRFAEVLVRIIRGLQTGLGLADEAGDALKHVVDGEEHK
ncbi:TRAP transporter small permease [Gallaecimonas pentaromativorans]|uniref:TRAP transporter small permease protein n=1 Tax=Gallaecimonas pentaromativorans TaxID=584787 RepID=A0A3N1PF56_9GAMM|nr:TRAP transporter small permease [Gallaecimonas pentaromativorans]ROQ30584.1 C4-dicarboxylate transporter DctQ subunit [Gallaecimonas pentaromativorans]